jgi:hypothetical protein
MTFKQVFCILFGFIGIITACYAEDRALLVGIDNYQCINSLIGSKQDVKNMTQFIQSEWHYQPGQIRTLTDDAATRNGILKAFDDWLIRGSQAGDKVLFYYSGHGAFVQDDNRYPDESDGFDEALCPVNACQQNGKRINLIRDDDINQRLKRLKGRQAMIIVDACHSGTITKSAFGRSDPTIKVPTIWGKPPSSTKSAFERDAFVESQGNVVAYSAVGARQEALVDNSINPPTGVFTRRFIEGIRDKKADRNHDGKVSHRELLAYTRRESKAYCDTKIHCQRGLTPQLEIKSSMSDEDIRIWAAIIDSIPQSAVQGGVIIEPQFGDLHLSVLPSHRLQQGQRMQVQISSSRTGYLLLFDVDSTGELKRLYPNPYHPQKSVRIIGGKTRIIPDTYSGFDLLVPRIAGQQLLVALLVNNANELSTLQASLPVAFSQVSSKNAQVALQPLRQQLGEILRRKNVGNHISWAIATVNYDVNP